MLTQAEAISAAKNYMVANGVDFGGCVNVLEFPDGSVTLHFEKPVTVSVPEGWVLVTSSPQIVIVVVNRHNGSVGLPEMLGLMRISSTLPLRLVPTVRGGGFGYDGSAPLFYRNAVQGEGR